jgi:outer membrane protein OmpA-like peptidoglycan-associated protein
VKEIADMMKADKSIRILIKAWGDPTGGEEANASISLMRAERVKMVLGQWLIPADRIEVEGCGIKHDAPNDSEARVAVITEIKY